MSQATLSRNPDDRQVAETENDGMKPLCPDCGSYVGASKGGGKPLPDREAKAFGWSCEECNLTLPTNCHGPSAPSFNDRIAGLQVEFRDGHTRYVPVPSRYVDVGGEQA